MIGQLTQSKSAGTSIIVPRGSSSADIKSNPIGPSRPEDGVVFSVEPVKDVPGWVASTIRPRETV